MKWASAVGPPQRAFVVVGAAGLAVIGLALGTGNTSIALFGALVPIVLAWLLTASEVRPGQIPALAAVVIVAQPFLRLVGIRGIPAYALNLLFCMIFAWWMTRVGAASRNAALVSVRPLLFALGGLLLALALAFVVTASVDRSTVLSLLQYAVLGVFIVMGALAAETYEGALRACRLLLYAGLLQVPIVVGQATGWIDRVPGLAVFMAKGYRDAVVLGTDVVRYPGSIGSAELMAEYCGLLFLLGVGLSTMVETGSRRWTTMGVTCVIFMLGWMTSTRGFIVGAVAGVLVFLLFRSTPSGSRGQRIVRLLLLASAAAAVVAWLVPREVSEGYLGRILMIETSGPNVLNRGLMFSTWNRLLGEMPWYGFGGNYLEVLQSNFSDAVIVAPHSLYYSMAFAGGWAALLAMVALLGMVVLSAARSMREGDAHVRALGSVLMVVVLYWISSELKIEFIRSMWYGNLIFFVLGVVAGLAGLTRRQQSEGGMSGAAELGHRSHPSSFAEAGTLAPDRRP